MPRLSKAEQEEREAREASKAEATVPYSHSVACRRCGGAVSFDPPEDGGDSIQCPGCGTTNLIPTEVLADGAD